jgi:hypothetical protein
VSRTKSAEARDVPTAASATKTQNRKKWFMAVHKPCDETFCEQAASWKVALHGSRDPRLPPRRHKQPKATKGRIDTGAHESTLARTNQRAGAHELTQAAVPPPRFAGILMVVTWVILTPRSAVITPRQHFPWIRFQSPA